MARLIAATCPKCGAGVRLDPDKQFVTCSYCGVSSFIETPKRRATEEMQHSAQPIIHVERVPSRGSGCLGAVIALVILGVGGAVAAGVLLSSTGRSLGVGSSAPFGIPIPLPSGVSLPSPLAASDDFFKDPSSLKRAMEERLGKPVMIKELILYPSYARFDAQDPKNKQHLDSYWYRGGSIQDPEPVRLSGSDRDVDKLVFSLDQIAYDQLPTMIQSALKELPLEEGHVSHVIITRDVFTQGRPAIRVYVTGPRDSGGYVEFTPTGSRRKVVH
ncbi:MAG: hypothetical protein QM756_21455 [Polyangiaceae bacterium]